jgi:hypothetical protein
MKTKLPLTFIIVIVLSVLTARAQDGLRASSSMYLPALSKPDVTVPFDVTAEGHRFNPTWGLDQAWIWDRNLYKGINHMGKENVGVGRSAFRFTQPLVNDTQLAEEQIRYLKDRSEMFDRVSPTLPIIFTADQEAGTDSYYVTKNTSWFNTTYTANIDHWAAMINSHVEWMQQNTQHPVIAISPFNEGDYWTEEEHATATVQYQAAQKLKQNYPACSDIAMVGGNTLNDDKALDWYTPGKQWYDWGNTHQLAGSFDNFARFYQQLAQDGKVGYADEMHNVGEAMIGLEYGMTVGIWWGFDSRARGEFCQISRHGVRLAYGEHRNNWTAASVYRHDDGRVKAFLGSSERQAVTTSYQLLSTARDVYYDGYGPVREYLMEMPGGTGYQSGQTNAERVIDVTWGDDVQPMPITDGIYKLVNKATGNAATVASDGNIITQSYNGSSTQQWEVTRVSPRIGGDFSHYEIKQAGTAQTHINVWNFSTDDGGDIRSYANNAKPDENEQWYFEYAGNGYYYIRNRMNALYLAAASSGNNVLQRTLQTNATALNRLLWRLLPVDVTYETTAPRTVSNLNAEANAASVTLTWTASPSTDVAGYMVLRAPEATGEWNTIARCLPTTQFTDNTCQPGIKYQYKVKTIDRAQNQSKASNLVEATPTGTPSLIASWQMEDNLQDSTVNMMDAALSGAPAFTDDAHNGQKALQLSDSQYVQLPYEVASSDSLTVALWVKWDGGNAWQRIFDFGRDTDHYLFLTPANGNNGHLRFAIKNGGGEEQVDADAALTAGEWKHVAVTIAPSVTTIYVNGQPSAVSNSVTISPADVQPVLNYIGRSQFTADPNLQATIDDVRIYNYALTSDDVVAVMNGEEPAVELEEPVFGDVNGDRLVDQLDLSEILSYVLGMPVDDPDFSPEAANLNGDENVDIVDVTLLIELIKNKE